MTAPAETKVSLQSETSILSESMLGEAYHHEGQKNTFVQRLKKRSHKKTMGLKKSNNP